MDDLIPVLFIIIGAIASSISSSKKKKEKQAAEERRQAAVKARIEAAQKNGAPNAARPAAPIQPTVIVPTSFADVPGQMIAPMIHPHIQPDCDVHDAPGSLGVTSTEGKDPCHEEQLTHARTFMDPVQEEGGLALEWSGESMVKAFIMQEVLARPCQRHAR